MKIKALQLLKILIVLLLAELTAYGQNSKPKEKNGQSDCKEEINIYRSAYLEYKSALNQCDSLSILLQDLQSTLTKELTIKQARINKFEAILYKPNGKKRKPLNLFFVWKRHLKKF